MNVIFYNVFCGGIEPLSVSRMKIWRTTRLYEQNIFLCWDFSRTVRQILLCFYLYFSCCIVLQFRFQCGEWENRTPDLRRDRATLCHSTNSPFASVAGLEPATFWLTVKRSTRWAKQTFFIFTVDNKRFERLTSSSSGERSNQLS